MTLSTWKLYTPSKYISCPEVSNLVGSYDVSVWKLFIIASVRPSDLIHGTVAELK